MATNAKMNFNFHQQHKYGTMPKSDNEMAVSQDMHLKMSKKIAQLTKVIYALNTKNDEHDAIVSAIETRHTAHVAQVLEESRYRVEQLEARVKSEVSSSEVNDLRHRVSLHKEEREQFLFEMKAYKDSVEQRDSQHAAKLAALTLALEDNRRRLFENDAEVVRLRTECTSAISASAAQHQASLASVRSEHEAEAAGLHARLDAAQQELRDTMEENEAKMAKTRAFYENELASLTHASNASADQRLEAAVARANNLQRDLDHERAQAEQRIAGLVEQLSVSEEKNETAVQQLGALKESLRMKASETDEAENKLLVAKETISKLQLRLLEMDKDVSGLRETCEQQKKDLLSKSTDIAALQATKLHHETELLELKNTITRLQSDLNTLEASRRVADNNKQSVSDRQAARICELQQSLEETLAQKTALEKQHAEELRSIHATQEGALQQKSSEHEAKLAALMKENTKNYEKQRADAEKALDSLRKESEHKLNEEISRLTAELMAAREEYELKKQDLYAQLTVALQKVETLEKASEENAKGLGSATSHIDNLKDNIARLKVTLDETKEQLKTAKVEMATLQAEYEKLKLQHDSKMKEAAVELKKQLSQLSKERDDHWSAKMRSEMDLLRSELSVRSEIERRSALSKLATSKDEELDASRLGWENKVKELLEEISNLKQQLEAQFSSTEDQLMAARAELMSQREELLKKMADEEAKMKMEMAKRKQSWDEAIEKATSEKEAALKELETQLTASHMEAMQAQLVGHRCTLDAARIAADKEKNSSLEAEREHHRQEMERFEEESRHRQAAELDQMNSAYEEQLAAARLQLERALEVGRQQEADHAMQTEEMQEDLRRHEDQLNQFAVDLELQLKTVDDLTRELEAKGREILAVRSESTQIIRAQASQLQESHVAKMNELKSQTAADMTKMLEEFTEAQDLLKEKITQLQNMLEEAEERYQNRESRPEDIDAITNLQVELELTRKEIQKLVDEKRFFQLELVNRETNFNKVFGVTPQVGLINPLASKRVKSETKVQGMKLQNSPGGIGRLDPIPGSPVHDGRFNHIRPLPPAIKKPIK